MGRNISKYKQLIILLLFSVNLFGQVVTGSSLDISGSGKVTGRFFTNQFYSNKLWLQGTSSVSLVPDTTYPYYPNNNFTLFEGSSMGTQTYFPTWKGYGWRMWFDNDYNRGYWFMTDYVGARKAILYPDNTLDHYKTFQGDVFMSVSAVVDSVIDDSTWIPVDMAGNAYDPFKTGDIIMCQRVDQAGATYWANEAVNDASLLKRITFVVDQIHGRELYCTSTIDQPANKGKIQKGDIFVRIGNTGLLNYETGSNTSLSFRTNSSYAPQIVLVDSVRKISDLNSEPQTKVLIGQLRNITSDTNFVDTAKFKDKSMKGAGLYTTNFYGKGRFIFTRANDVTDSLYFDSIKIKPRYFFPVNDTTDGLYLTDTVWGYYADGQWQKYIDSVGNIRLIQNGDSLFVMDSLGFKIRANSIGANTFLIYHDTTDIPDTLARADSLGIYIRARSLGANLYLVYNDTTDIPDTLSLRHLKNAPQYDSVGYLYNDGLGVLRWVKTSDPDSTGQITIVANPPLTGGTITTTGYVGIDTTNYIATHTWVRNNAPTNTWEGITGKPTTLAGYGITTSDSILSLYQLGTNLASDVQTLLNYDSEILAYGIDITGTASGTETWVLNQNYIDSVYGANNFASQFSQSGSTLYLNSPNGSALGGIDLNLFGYKDSTWIVGLGYLNSAGVDSHLYWEANNDNSYGILVDASLYATTAGSANSVTWDNVSGKPTLYTKAQIDSIVATIPDSSIYATRYWVETIVPTLSVDTSIIATHYWVDTQGFLKSVDLSNYLLKTDVGDSIDTHLGLADGAYAINISGSAAGLTPLGQLTILQSVQSMLNYQPDTSYGINITGRASGTESWVGEQGFLVGSDTTSFRTYSDLLYQPKGSYLIASDLNGYATETWVLNQNYIDSVYGASNYATQFSQSGSSLYLASANGSGLGGIDLDLFGYKDSLGVVNLIDTHLGLADGAYAINISGSAAGLTPLGKLDMFLAVQTGLNYNETTGVYGIEVSNATTVDSVYWNQLLGTAPNVSIFNNDAGYTTLGGVQTMLNWDEQIQEYNINISGTASGTESWVLNQNYVEDTTLTAILNDYLLIDNLGTYVDTHLGFTEVGGGGGYYAITTQFATNAVYADYVTWAGVTDKPTLLDSAYGATNFATQFSPSGDYLYLASSNGSALGGINIKSTFNLATIDTIPELIDSHLNFVQVTEDGGYYAITTEFATNAVNADNVDWSGIANKPALLDSVYGASNFATQFSPSGDMLYLASANGSALGGINLISSFGLATIDTIPDLVDTHLGYTQVGGGGGYYAITTQFATNAVYADYVEWTGITNKPTLVDSAYGASNYATQFSPSGNYLYLASANGSALGGIDLITTYNLITDSILTSKNYTTLGAVQTMLNWDYLIQEYDINISGTASGTESWVINNYVSNTALIPYMDSTQTITAIGSALTDHSKNKSYAHALGLGLEYVENDETRDDLSLDTNYVHTQIDNWGYAKSSSIASIIDSHLNYETNYDNSYGILVDQSKSADVVPWSGVSSKPTTLSGYGITDALSTSGGYTGTVYLLDDNANPIRLAFTNGQLTSVTTP